MKLILLCSLAGATTSFSRGDEYSAGDEAEALRLVAAGFAKVHADDAEAFAAALAEPDAEQAQLAKDAQGQAEAEAKAEAAVKDAEAAQELVKAPAAANPPTTQKKA